jgi:outer membrane protein OmpA-like peptidoglycan-associated protein/tetratricopeptide (TPR) repeat protein
MKTTISPNNLAIILIAAFLASCANGYIKSGDKEIENLSYSKAITKYEKAVKKQPDNMSLKLKLADAHQHLNHSDIAESYYQDVADSMELPDPHKLKFAQVLMKNNKYDDAKGYLTSYLESNPSDQLARDLLASTSKVDELKEDTSAYILSPVPLDFTVSMFGPAYYDKGIVFAGETEIVSAASTNPWTGYSFLDLFYIEKDGDGNWDIAEKFSEELNGKFHDGPASFNKAQDMIVYTRSAMKNEKKQLVNEENENQFSLYMSKKTGETWSDPQELPFNSMEYSVGHPALSADGKTLYFVSDMPGGYGGSDIYKTTHDGSSWSEPVNLGKTINTPGNEVFPHLGNDDKLYFSSEGHQNLGGLDVFVSQNRSGVWSSPINLAYPLNSSQDDFAIAVSDNDTTGFVSSNRSGSDMIYEFVKVPPVYILNGIAKLKSTGAPIAGVQVKLINLTAADSAVIVTGVDGKFTYNLLPNQSYRVVGSKEGYFTVSKNFETTAKSEEKNVPLEFEIDEIVASQSGTGSGNPKFRGATALKTYDVGDVFYDYNSAKIRKDAEDDLNNLVRLLKDNPGVSIELQSHCDSRGSDGYNQNLSNKRAQSVVDYLIAKGIAKGRLQAKGFGESQLVNNCTDGVECTEEEHQANRRTEFIVLENAQ